jgi:hypothetical protein
VTATGGTGTLTYTLLPDSINNETGIFTGLDAGDYTIEVTDENGCGPADTSATLTEPAAVTITDSSGTDVTCFGGSDGMISVQADGGSGSFIYLLLPDSIENSTGEFTGLDAGTYYVKISDTNGCVAEMLEFTLSQPDKITIESITLDHPDGPAEENGSITVIATGGNGQLTYAIHPLKLPPNQTGLFTGLDEGSYRIFVNDTSNCGPVFIDTLLKDTTATSVHDLVGQYRVKLYPNPAQSNLHLEMYLDRQSDVRIEFINSIGQSVAVEKFTGENGRVIRTIDVSSFGKGMYFVRFFISGDYKGKTTIMID